MTIEDLLELHEETCDKCRDIMAKKNNDYTGGKTAKDIFANFKASQILNIHPVKGILMRMVDKIQRIQSFTNDRKLEVPNESVYDACEDIINYAILAKAMLTEERDFRSKLYDKIKKEYKNSLPPSK